MPKQTKAPAPEPGQDFTDSKKRPNNFSTIKQNIRTSLAAHVMLLRKVTIIRDNQEEKGRQKYKQIWKHGFIKLGPIKNVLICLIGINNP